MGWPIVWSKTSYRNCWPASHREGATHSLFHELWKQRIGALTYRKNVKDVWPEDEFVEHEVPAPGGGATRMKLAMRETRIGAGKESMPVIEVRRLTQTGHQDRKSTR